MTAATCPRCGRPTESSGVGKDFHETCFKPGSRSCRIAAAGYRAGIARGVALAKEHVRIVEEWQPHTVDLDWLDVDEAAKGET